MKYITLFVSCLFALTTATAQSLKLDNSNLKTQQLLLGKQELHIDYNDFSTVAVAANCDYQASTTDTWLTLKRMANGNTAVFASPNYDMSARTGTITFTSADGSVVRTLPETW